MPFSSVRNYFESLVFDEVIRQMGISTPNDVLSDVACIALNHLPPRYIRHEVDMFFYLSPQERAETTDKVEKAVKDAIAYVGAKG